MLLAIYGTTRQLIEMHFILNNFNFNFIFYNIYFKLFSGEKSEERTQGCCTPEQTDMICSTSSLTYDR